MAFDTVFADCAAPAPEGGSPPRVGVDAMRNLLWGTVTLESGTYAELPASFVGRSSLVARMEAGLAVYNMVPFQPHFNPVLTPF